MSLPIFYLCFAGILGVLIGSFLNVVILRWPKQMAWNWRKEALEWLSEPAPKALELEDDIVMEAAAKEALARHTTKEEPAGIVVKGSHCPKCQTPIHWYDNLPIIGWILLRGKCRACHQGISPQYPLVEATMAGLAVACVAVFGWTPEALATSIFMALLLVLAVIDMRTMLLPDDLVMPGLWGALAWSVAAAQWWPGQAITPTQALLGAIIGYGGLTLIIRLYAAIRKKEGMGGGDLKLLGLLGAFLGPMSLAPILGMAAIGGAIYGTYLRVRDGESKPFPFGPWLAIAGATWVLFGEPLGQLI